MFIKLKIFFKKYFRWIYKPVHDLLFPTYLKLVRNKKLEDFKARQLFNFDFAGIAFNIWLDPQNGFVDEEIYANGVYEPEVLLMYKKYIKTGDTYVDIGTNIGQHALFAAKVVGPQGRVVCYEPIKHLFAQLTDSKNENNFSHMQLVNKAIGKEVGEAQIYINRKNIGASSLYQQSNSNEEQNISIGIGEELDSLAKINFIKIDTEGYEWIVLQTITPYIEKHKPIIFFEYTPGSYEGTAKADILDILLSRNYTLMDVEAGYAKITEAVSWSDSFTKTQTNILCLPN